MHRTEARDSGMRKVLLGSAEPFQRQGLEEIVESAREAAETRESRQEERKTSLHSFYCRRLFRDTKIMDCAVLRRMDLTAREMLRYRALEARLNKLEKKAESDRVELPRRVQSWKKSR